MAQALFMNSEVYDVELTSQLISQKERDLLKSTSNLIDFDSKVGRQTDRQMYNYIIYRCKANFITAQSEGTGSSKI